MRNAIALLLVLAIGALGTLAYAQESTIRQREQSVQLNFRPIMGMVLLL